MASKYKKQACYEKAAQHARHRATEAHEKKERKQAEKHAKEQKKSETSHKMCGDKSKDDKDIPKTGATNVKFYPVYHQVMSHLLIEFVTHMREEKDPSLYEQFVNKFILHVSAIDTFC